MVAGGDERRRCAALLADLGVDPSVDLSALADVLSQRRGRPIRIVGTTRLGEPSGAWIATDDLDVVVYDAALSGHWRRHAIAHELGHIAFDHGREIADDESVLALLLHDLDLDRGHFSRERGAYTNPEEREAEAFASELRQEPTEGVIASLPEAVRDQAAGIAATFGSRRDRLA